MFDRYRQYFPAALGLIVIGAILIYGKLDEPTCADILRELSLEGPAPEENQYSPQSNTVTCEADCQVSFLRPSQNDEIAKANQRSSDAYCNTADELDLLAQERMAHWTAYITGMTAIGLLILGMTLWEAFSASLAAAEAALATKAQAIAYLGISNVSWSYSDVNKRLSIRIALLRAGISPLTKIKAKCTVSLFKIDSYSPPKATLLSKYRSTSSGYDIVSNHNGQLHAFSEKMDSAIESIADSGDLGVQLSIAVRYRDVLGDVHFIRDRYNDILVNPTDWRTKTGVKMYPGTVRRFIGEKKI